MLPQASFDLRGQPQPRLHLVLSAIVTLFLYILLTSHATRILNGLEPSLRLAQKRQANARVVVMTVWTHYPEMMRAQVASLRAFLQHDFEYLAISNGPDDDPIHDDVAAVARNLSVAHYQQPYMPNNGPSYSHALALRGGLVQMLRRSTHLYEGLSTKEGSDNAKDNAESNGGAASNVPLLGPRDMLFLLDTDMFLMSPMDLHHELGDARLLSWPHSRNTGSRTIHYLWPNLSVFYFGGSGGSADTGEDRRRLADNETYALLSGLDFGPCSLEGASLDSGGHTAKLLDERGYELGLAQLVQSCSLSDPDFDRQTCLFVAEQNALPREGQCTISHVLENKAVGVSAGCQLMYKAQVPGMQTPDANAEGRDGAEWHDYDRHRHYAGDPCRGYGKVFHLGSGGSNWRGCPDDFLAQRRKDLIDFIEKQIERAL